MKIRSSHNPFHPRTLPLTTAPRTERAPAEQTSLSPEVRQQATDSVHLSSLVDGLESNYGGEEAESENAREVYARHGAQPHDLNDRRAVGQLISRAPQLDDLDGRRVTLREAAPGQAAERARVDTDGDETRCGGASLFNSLLLDGNSQANARALRLVAEQRSRAVEGQDDSFQMNDVQRNALRHMSEGSLTPREAAVLQEMTYDMSRTSNSQEPGLSTRQIGDTLRDLREAGGLQNSREVNIRGENHGGPLGHATVSVRRDGGGRHFANSWPQDNGYATVTGQSGTAFAPGDHPERNFQTSVTYQRNQGGDSSRLVYRAAAGPRNEAEAQTLNREGTLRPLQIQCPVEPDQDCFTPHRVYPGDMRSR